MQKALESDTQLINKDCDGNASINNFEFQRKFSVNPKQSYITQDTLGLINGSETINSLIRAYEADPSGNSREWKERSGT